MIITINRLSGGAFFLVSLVSWLVGERDVFVAASLSFTSYEWREKKEKGKGSHVLILGASDGKINLEG